MKRRLIAAVIAGVMCTGMAFPAAAESSGGGVPAIDGTDIYAGVTLEDPDAKIKVEVPTLFAFVVNGTVATGNTTAVESAITINGQNREATIMLPNVKVKVDSANATTGAAESYHLETVSSGNWKFVNYSTKADTGTSAVDGRIGMPVNVVGSIKNEGTEASRNGWNHISNADDSTMTGQTAGFKKYTLEVNGEKFSDVSADGSFGMANSVTLAAPNLNNGGVNADTGYANVGKQTDATFNVHVGGQRSQYNKVEESAKVGTIVWTIQAETQQVPQKP